MPVYTRTGDRGKTSLFNGQRVSKSASQIEAYGTVDELTSFIGLVASLIKNDPDRIFLIGVQKDLYRIMAVLSGSSLDLKSLEEKVVRFEKKIDSIDKDLPKLRRFIIPGGTEKSAWFHVLRVIGRRAERNVVRFNNDSLIVKYLNRLSDLFFTLARRYGHGKEIVL